MSGPIVWGLFDGELAPSIDDREIRGLARESTYLWGLLRTIDGDVFQLMRRLADGASWPSRLLFQSNVGAAGLQRHETERLPAHSGDVRIGTTAGGPSSSAAPTGAAEPMSFEVEASSARWSEGGLVAVEGPEVSPGLQWCLLPTDDGGSGGMRYCSRIFHVTGHIDGLAVTGFVGMDVVHLQPDRQNYVDDPITAGHLSSAWCTWATEWDDGQVEAGHIAFGPEGFGFALRADGADAHGTTAVTGTVTSDEAGRPTQIAFDVNGPDGPEAWEFVAETRALALEPLPGPVRQSEGLFRRVGEQRRPVTWCATPEVPAPPPATRVSRPRCGQPSPSPR